jgi:peroxiredoxin
MVSASNSNLLQVDWSKIPAPMDDGGAKHLPGAMVADLELSATNGTIVSLARLTGRTVLFAYPRTGTPGQISIVDDWDMIPGARGCTPQSCAFRDLHAELKAAGATRVYGLSTQDTVYQSEVVERLHLPFPLLSDKSLSLARAMDLPLMQAAHLTLLKRMALIIDDGRISHVFYPVFPPDQNAADVLAWLRANPRSTAQPKPTAMAGPA